jgi:hypothetical protein
MAAICTEDRNSSDLLSSRDAGPDEVRNIEEKNMRKNAMYISNGYAKLAFPGGDQLETARLNRDHSVRTEDGQQLCEGGSFRGYTLEYHSDEALARACNARLYKTEAGFKRATARLADAYPHEDDDGY